MTCKCESITSHSASHWVNMLLSVAVAWGSHIASLLLTVLAPKPLAVVRLWWWSWCCYCYLPCMFHCIAMVSCFVSSELVPPITLCYLSWWCMYILELFNFGWWRPHSTNNGITASPPGTTQPYVQSHEGTRRHHPLQWWCTAMMTQSIIMAKNGATLVCVLGRGAVTRATRQKIESLWQPHLFFFLFLREMMSVCCFFQLCNLLNLRTKVLDVLGLWDADRERQNC